MERLTKREYGEITYSKNRDIMCGSFCNSCSVGTGNCNTVKAMVEKLAEYEDLEEQGRLLRLPCKLGDTIYAIIPSFSEMRYIIVDYEVVYYTCNSSGEQYLSCVRRNNEERYSYGISVKDIGNTVFLTREEAEDKLKELEENNGR